MLLFPQQKEEKTALADKVFYILSVRESVNEQLSQGLSQAGFNKIEHIRWEPGMASDLALSSHAWGIIVDIGTLQQYDNIIISIQGIVPRGIWCCAVGDSDSISLAQAFARHGIHYFYLHAQADELIQAAASGTVAKVQRSAVNISILGCKGGIGNTTLAYQLVNRLVQLRQKPTLFIQGKSGSHDLDLLFDKKFTQTLMPINRHLDAMSWTDVNFPDLDSESFEKYNFIIFEESINSAGKEQLWRIVERTSCLILTLDRSISSVRIVRQIIEIHDVICRTQNTPRRLLLCLNDSRPVTQDMLDVKDLQILLGRKINIVFPWRNVRANARFSALRLRSKKAQLESLLQQVLGEFSKPKSTRFRWFSEIKRKS